MEQPAVVIHVEGADSHPNSAEGTIDEFRRENFEARFSGPRNEGGGGGTNGGLLNPETKMSGGRVHILSPQQRPKTQAC